MKRMRTIREKSISVFCRYPAAYCAVSFVCAAETLAGMPVRTVFLRPCTGMMNMWPVRRNAVG